MSNQGQQEQITIRDGIKRGIIEAMESDPSVIVLGEDVAGGAGTAEYDAVGSWGGVFGVTGGLVERFGRDRVLDTPLAETALMGTAIGAAIGGLRPVVEIMFADFLGVCFEPILNQGSRVRYISGGQVKVPVVIRAPYGAGLCAGSQHSGTYYSLFAHLPGVKVVAPSNPADAQGLMTAAIRDNNLVMYFEHKAMYNDQGPAAPAGHRVPLGKCAVAREGTDVTIVGIGQTVDTALKAAKELATQGVECEVVDLRSIVPLDLEGVLASVRKTGRLVVVDEDNPRCSVATDLVAQVWQSAFDDLEAPPATVLPPNVPVPFGPGLEAAYMPKASDVTDCVLKLLG